MQLSPEHRLFLLKLARARIEREFNSSIELPSKPNDELYDRTLGAFVTLHRHGQLRGCIGYIEGVAPLYDTIVQMAEAAAFRDHRFPPVSQADMETIDIEISVLTPLKTISDPKTVEVGKHGLHITRGHYHGVLLPQVATEQGWDRQTFLEHTCLKAGLPRTAYQEADVTLSVFSAIVFGEKNKDNN
jgi:uncharacterized protein